MVIGFAAERAEKRIPARRDSINAIRTTHHELRTTNSQAAHAAKFSFYFLDDRCWSDIIWLVEVSKA
jgi:hypothetical protein